MPRKRNNGEGSIRKRSNGRYEVRVSAGTDPKTGKYRKISKYYGTKTEATQAIHKLSEEVSKGSYGTSGNFSLVQWLWYCLDTYMRNSIKQSTYISYRAYIKNHFEPSFKNRRLQRLTPAMLQEFYNYKYEECGLSSKTIRNLNNFLHKALSQACNEGILSRNVAECVELPKDSKPRITILTVDEQQRLAAESYNHRYGVFVRLVLVTGMRLGELLGLSWDNVDFYSNKIYIRQTLNRLLKYDTAEGEKSTEIVFDTPKSENSVRTIPLINAAVEDLKAWKKVQERDRELAASGYIESGLVVTNELGGYLEPRTFKDYYDKMLKGAGLDNAGITFHALRHTFATRSLERKMDPKTLSTILGHYSVSFTLDTYAHVLEDHKKEEMDKRSDLYFTDTKQAPNSFAVVVSSADGIFKARSADFAGITAEGKDINVCINKVKTMIQAYICSNNVTVVASPSEIDLTDYEFVVMVSV